MHNLIAHANVTNTDCAYAGGTGIAIIYDPWLIFVTSVPADFPIVFRNL